MYVCGTVRQRPIRRHGWLRCTLTAGAYFAAALRPRNANHSSVQEPTATPPVLAKLSYACTSAHLDFSLVRVVQGYCPGRAIFTSPWAGAWSRQCVWTDLGRTSHRRGWLPLERKSWRIRRLGAIVVVGINSGLFENWWLQYQIPQEKLPFRCFHAAQSTYFPPPPRPPSCNAKNPQPAHATGPPAKNDVQKKRKK
jgi:hypothetical protein